MESDKFQFSELSLNNQRPLTSCRRSLFVQIYLILSFLFLAESTSQRTSSTRFTIATANSKDKSSNLFSDINAPSFAIIILQFVVCFNDISLTRYDIISVPHMPQAYIIARQCDIISKIYHPFRKERISLKKVTFVGRQK